MNRTIYTFWTGENEMSKNRLECIEQLQDDSGMEVVLVTPKNLHSYIVKSAPLHDAYQYLSETHKADYLRTYFMNFHGGGYSDIKKTTGSWSEPFNQLESGDYWINGYSIDYQEVAYTPLMGECESLIGNAAYISKPDTPLTIEWYSEMISLLDKKLTRLKKFPATFPQEHSGRGFGLFYQEGLSKYPIGWNEMLGHIFHRISYKYRHKILKTIPMPILKNYR
jgi:hypothetical protein